MKRIESFLLFMTLTCLSVFAQGVKPLPTLHVEGKWLVDSHGNHVVLHGVMDTPSIYFNGGRWGDWRTGVGYNNSGVTPCINYFEKLFAGLEEAKCNVFRLHMDPAWTNDPSDTYKWSGSTGQASDANGEADIRKFNPTRLTTFLRSLYFPLAKRAMNHGMYVVVRPPGVCPGSVQVGDYYNKYLMTVWDLFSKNDSVRKYAGQISIELANEPVSLKNALGLEDPKALHDFFQPIVDRIRANGFTGIIWAPGTGWQANYTSYATYPIEGDNIGYAVHDYCGWYSSSDDTPDPNRKIQQFHKQVPVVDFAPVIITEVDWSPENPKAEGHYNEHGDWVQPNYGTWATGSTSKWGKAFKACLDHYGNISMTLSGTGCLLDIDTLLSKKKVVPAFGGLEEACGKACMDWYADYYQKDWPRADFSSVPVSDRGTRYENPIVRTDFPDPDVIRVGNTYYMVSTTMHHFPGATILKSQDMVNWEYCAQPIKQLSDNTEYNLQGTTNAYGSGMWACSMKYHNGKFHILINEKQPGDGWNLQGWLLTATNPEGTWEAKKLPRSYYDPGMLFDNGKVYVACGIGNIMMCELDENFNFKQEKKVISDREGLEGSHLYKRGGYYYIYATYGGWPSGQAVFRSKDIFGPYEEKMLVEKTIDGKPNTVHQGALIEDTKGAWWTIMQEDLGALGRMPNLQPVKWVSDWPVVGDNGKPYASYTKPAAVGDNGVKRLPTTDPFRSYPLGMQWEWNHAPLAKGWSLFERPGWLRLKMVKAASLAQARNMLTQRIFANSSTATTGTIRLDVHHLNEGDRAGICILQDPYAAIAVEVKDGKHQLVWWQENVRDAGSSFKAAEQTQAFEMTADSVIYLRAAIKYGEDKARFYYSLDNKDWTPLGGETAMTFNLTVFVGARFGLFCYTTNTVGGMADFDWFSTESDFNEKDYYPELTPHDTDTYTATKLEPSQASVDILTNSWRTNLLTATFQDKHQQTVTDEADYTCETPGIVTFYRGQMLATSQGTTKVNATYTDPLGNKLTTSFTVQASYFPLDLQYLTTLNGDVSYKQNATNSVFRFNKAGQKGWVYDSGIDLSDYRFLVVELQQKQTANAHLNIFPTTNVSGACYASHKFGDDLEIVIDLEKATYTSTTSKGKALDRKNIHMVTFAGDNEGKMLVLKDIFLSNDPKYATGIVELTCQQAQEPVRVYDLSGRLLRSGLHQQDVMTGLPAGIYIVNGKKVVKR